MSNVKLFLLSTFECRTSNCFDVRHLNVKSLYECGTSNCFDVRHSNVESQNYMNVEHQTVLTFDIRMSNVKLF